MFDIVRNNKKVVQIVMAILLLPFAFFGVDSYIRNSGSVGDVCFAPPIHIQFGLCQFALEVRIDHFQIGR